ncbi:relaxase/mobilization nuclease [Streptomyces sp. H39-C1]|uniref:relaxase/mobilization nuclease n=1 Tax=Streptomyces sp. H39-C1 TaxID=3004355 RepID=UPI0022B05E8E|nr:relaxase/mobilization nuclease [Streptomyces sp. H39-C1]MCZ4101805.1 relaxase/mobilization nuclease [Streptomyces sp. H39-C1]
MIFRVHERTHTAHDPLTAALGRPVSPDDGLTEYTVVAHWPGLDSYTLDDEQKIWTSAQWAEHLEDPLLEHPFAASPTDDRRAILHLHARLHHDDRDLSPPEWAEVAHRLARVAGIEVPGDQNGCRWIAVQAQLGHLDLIANLIRLDGEWATQPAGVLQRLSSEARRIEGDLRLTPAPAAPTPQPLAPPVPTATGHLASILSQLADEHTGPLATVRSLVEHAAHRIARQPGAASGNTSHRLELIARWLYVIQQDLDTTAARLSVVRPSVAAAPPAVRSATHRSP